MDILSGQSQQPMGSPPAGAANSAFGPNNTPFDALGGLGAVRALVDRFYDHMDGDARFATIRSLHPPDLSLSREKLYEFLAGWLGGPPLYIQKYGHPKLRGRHMHVKIDVAQRDQWLGCMKLALDERKIEGELRQFLDARFAHVANFLRNQG